MMKLKIQRVIVMAFITSLSVSTTANADITVWNTLPEPIRVYFYEDGTQNPVCGNNSNEMARIMLSPSNKLVMGATSLPAEKLNNAPAVCIRAIRFNHRTQIDTLITLPTPTSCDVILEINRAIFSWNMSYC